MPGTWFEALIVAGLAILLWQPSAGWRRIVIAGIVLGTSATFAQVGEALILPGIALPARGRRRLAARHRQGSRAVRGLRAAHPGLLHRLLPAHRGLLPVAHGVTSFYGRAAAAADCATIVLPPAERGMCPTRAQQAQGPDWLEYSPASPIRPYYGRLPRAEADSLITHFNHSVLTQQPLRVLGAYSRDVLKLFALTRTASPGDTPISRWQFQTTFPYFPPHATAGRSGPRSAASAAARPPSGGPSPRSCAPTSSTAAISRSAVLALHPGRPGVGGPAAPAGGPRDPPARPCLPAVLRLGGCPCCWFPTCSSSPGGTSCPRSSPLCRPARSGSPSSSARSAPGAVPAERPCGRPAARGGDGGRRHRCGCRG